jgi:drug/metabolite transporter (DMT)-like permease
MGTLEILFWRSLIGLALVCALLSASGALHRRSLQPQLIGWHLLRNAAHFGGQCAWLIAIAALPLAEVFVLEFTTPLWAALLAALLLGEPLSRGRWIALLLGLAGVLVILRPGAAAINPASLVMLAGAVGFAVSAIVTRKLTLLLYRSKHSFLLILCYMTAMQGIFSLLPILGEFRLPPGPAWPWLGVAAVTALAGHYCLTRALSCADAAVVMPIDYLRLPLIMVTAWCLYGEAVSLWLLAGSVLILAGNALGMTADARRTEARRTEARRTEARRA